MRKVIVEIIVEEDNDLYARALVGNCLNHAKVQDQDPKFLWWTVTGSRSHNPTPMPGPPLHVV